MKKTITEFLSKEYKEFAMYTIENRAFPSVVDSFKSSHRKIIHVSNQIWKNGNEKTLKVFQLAGKVASDCYYHHGNCLDLETNILLTDGSFISLKDWILKYPDIKFELASYDEENKKFTTGIGHSPRIGNITNIEYEIEMEDGSIIKCTENHPFLTTRGWIEAKDLLESDNIVSYIKVFIRITKIRINILENPKTFYDITVDKYHNFVINEKSMIVTHNSSLENAIVNMAQKFKNNIPFLEEDGQFGSLRSPQASASRYIGTKLSPFFRMVYKDFDLLEHRQEEGDLIEPYYFLPIIPTVLLNGTNGIAVGFSSNILPRNIEDIIENCLNLLSDKKLKKMNPILYGFNGTFENDKENPKRWIIKGVYEKTNNIIHIKELPPSMTYEKYEEILDKLIEEKKIQSYDDNCKDNIDYKIKLNKNSELKDIEIVKLLKLEDYSTEIFSTLDENGKLKIFETDEEILRYFVDFRMGFYKKRKDKQLKILKNELIVLSNKAKFIKAVLDNKIQINNNKKDVIFKQIEENNIEQIDGSYDYLLRMHIYSLTNEVYNKLILDFKSKEMEHSNLEKQNEKDMYITDLKNLKKELRSI